VLESLELSEPKTKVVQGILDAVGAGAGSLLVLAEPDEIVWRCGRNIPGLRICAAVDLNALDVMSARTVVLAREAIPALEERLQ